MSLLDRTRNTFRLLLALQVPTCIYSWAWQPWEQQRITNSFFYNLLAHQTSFQILIYHHISINENNLRLQPKTIEVLLRLCDLKYNLYLQWVLNSWSSKARRTRSGGSKKTWKTWTFLLVPKKNSSKFKNERAANSRTTITSSPKR